MSQIQDNIDLLPYNTFRVSAKAKEFMILGDLRELPREQPVLVLGKGANVLFTRNFDGLVIKNELQGKKIISENEDCVIVETASGENWIDLVNWSVDNNWSGIENLAFIPGTVGAAAIGNIAAYGGNFEDVLESVVAIDITSGKSQQFSKGELRFSYRESVFNKELRNKFFIASVTLKFSKKSKYDTSYHSRYESLQDHLLQMASPPYSPKQIAEVVTKLRLKKLPDWRKIGTAGSFFKNPLVLTGKAKELQKEISDLQIYPAEKLQYTDGPAGDFVKVPAGRLLDELGWRGKRIGNVGTWEKHALTVVNFGGATGQEIWDFTNQMKSDIKSNFDIDLEPEVKII